jgi:beta-carotene/zeaxanthin 4-ketolase
MKLTGIVIASSILVLWFALLILLLLLPAASVLIYSVPGIIMQTLLYTGLFITAHDAMHGTVAPGKVGVNTFFGTVSVGIYAMMSFKMLNSQHKFHHQFPGSQQDPDFHAEGNPAFFPWYFHFVKHYISIWQIIGMAIVFNIFHHLLGIPVINLLLFWALPSLLSTLQLFYFGTYLPHRETARPFPDHHRANSLNFPVFLSFLSCYHFGGFHHEHHLYPGVAWWQLPKKAGSLPVDFRRHQ